MKTVRQFSRVGPCLMLGELVTQTDTRIFYRLRDGKTAWAMKSSKLLVHLEPCPSCRDHERGSLSGRPWAKAAQGQEPTLVAATRQRASRVGGKKADRPP